MKVSIVLTTSKPDIFFKRAVNSLLMQTRMPYEVIVILDGFKNKNTENMWTQDFAPEWQVVWTERTGSNPATLKNIGMYQATGDWILLLDGGSFLLPSCLEIYSKILGTTKSDMITELMELSFVHNNFHVTKNIPNKDDWQYIVKLGIRNIFSGSWKKGDIPLIIRFIRSTNKIYFPIDFNSMEEKILILFYILEERRILLSDYCGTVRNISLPSGNAVKNHWEENRCKKIASNIHVNGWTSRDKIFEEWKSYEYPNEGDLAYIEKSASYLSIL